MRVSFIKFKQDKDSFKTWKGLGFEVIELEDLEQTEYEIQNLIQHQYDTIVVTTQVAGFSEDIFKKYNKKDDIRIIITPNKRK